MDLKKDITINPKFSKTMITIFCILGIMHELVLALSRLELSLLMPGEIFFTIGNTYSNNILADAVALIFRLFILFAVIFASYQNKKITTMTKGLVLAKILRILILYAALAYWLHIISTYPIDALDKIRMSYIKIEYIALYTLPAAEVILSAILIAKSSGKVRAIFIMVIIATLLDIFIYQIYDLLLMITPLSLDGFMYFIVSALYIICFLLSISIASKAAREQLST